jgi:hypothetical protein
VDRMIREVVLSAGLLYILITVVQIVQEWEVRFEGIAVGVFLLVAIGIFWYEEEDRLKIWENTAVWSMIFLFVIYSLLKAGGLL